MKIDGLEQDDVFAALHNGHRAEQHDKYSSTHSNWNYAIHGTDLSEREIRVVVSFRILDMAVVTVFPL